MPTPTKPESQPESDQPESGQADKPADKAPPQEVGGPEGPEPTRFGDWEKAGRCTDF